MVIFLLRSILQQSHENILVLLVALKPLEFMIIENKQLRIYLYSLNTPTLCLAKEDMFALVEKGFMRLKTFCLVITA